MGLRGVAVVAVLVALFIGCEAKERPNSCSAETGCVTGAALIQLKAKESSTSVKSALVNEDCKPQFCLIFGDPHMRTFDGGNTLIQHNGFFWIAKSDEIQIQGYGQHNGITQKVVVTGPFLKDADGKDHKITLTTTGFSDHTTVSWDGAELADTVFAVPGLVNIRNLSTSLATKQHVLELPEHVQAGMSQMINARSQHGTRGGHYHLELPRGVELFVTCTAVRHMGISSMEMIVKIPKNQGPFEGVCGNMNGNPDDDRPSMTRDSIMLQMTSSGCPEGCDDCDAAISACGNFKQAFYRDSCIFDACNGVDPQLAAQGALAAELMEVEDARDIPTFMGHGICLDANGNKYTTFENRGITSVDECKMALASNIPGLWGAQMHTGGACHLLVDPTHASLHSYTKVSDGPGSGMVSSVDEEEGYSCWRVV